MYKLLKLCLVAAPTAAFLLAPHPSIHTNTNAASAAWKPPLSVVRSTVTDSIAGVNGAVTPVDTLTYVDRTNRETTKEKIVVLGSGWAAVKFVQNIDTSKYDVTIVSPRNFFLFTPFLKFSIFLYSWR